MSKFTPRLRQFFSSSKHALGEEFYQSAKELYQTAPWRFYEGKSYPIEIQLPKLLLQESTCLSLFGGGDDRCGFTWFESATDYQAKLDYEDQPKGVPPALNTLSLWFDKKETISSGEKKRPRTPIEIAGETVYVEAFSERKGECCEVSSLEGMVLRGMAEMLMKIVGFLYQLPKDLVSIGLGVRTPEMPSWSKVTLFLPHSAFSLNFGDQAVQGTIRPIVDAFVRKAPQKKGNSPRAQVWRQALPVVPARLLEYKLIFQGGEPFDWKPSEIESSLLKFHPGHLTNDPHLIKATLDVLKTFFSWLENTQKILPKTASDIRNVLKRVRSTFLREAKNKDHYSFQKTLKLKMKEKGMNPNNKMEFERFLQETSQRFLALEKGFFHPEENYTKLFARMLSE